MFKEKRYLSLTQEELRVVVKSLVRLKNSLIRQGRYTDSVDEILFKITKVYAQ